MTSQKAGFARRLHAPDVDLIEQFQARYRELDIFRSFARAIEHKRTGLHPTQLRHLMTRGGPTRDEAMVAARLSSDPLVPYMTIKRSTGAQVLRLHRIDMASGLALPASNVKVADYDPSLNRTKPNSDYFKPPECELLRAHLNELVEVNLVVALTSE